MIYIISIIVCSITHYTYAQTATKQDQPLAAWGDPIAKSLHVIRSKSYNNVSFDSAIVQALNGLTQCVDENSRFLGPQEYKELMQTTQGTFYGIGVMLAAKRNEDDFVTVIDLVPDSPAAQQGVQRLDKIVAIDGKLLKSTPMDELIKKLKSTQRYSPVTLTLLRDSRTITVILKRDLIREEYLTCYHFKKYGIYYIALSLFTQTIADEFATLIQKILPTHPRGIILDLRNNAGGVVPAAAQCASVFLNKGSLVVATKDRNNKLIDEYRTQQEPLLKDVPLIILVNTFTASASEFLAGALRTHAQSTDQPNKHVFLLGSSTFGKGSVQEVIPVGNDCALKITTSLYYLPEDQSIDGKGLKPDFKISEVKQTASEKDVIHKLYKNRKEKKKQQPKPKQSPNPFSQDAQLQAAINIIELINVGKTYCPQQVKSHAQTASFISSCTCFGTEEPERIHSSAIQQ